MANVTFNTLPGTQFQVVDSPLVTGTPAPNGDTVLIVGCALDGPSDTPVNIAQVTDLEGLFGPLTFNADYVSPDGDTSKAGQYSYNTLVRTVSEAKLGGAQSILVCRTGGQTAAASGTILGGVTVSAYFAGNVYNGAQLTAQVTHGTGIVLTITKQPLCKGPSVTNLFTGVQFVYSPTTTIQSLVEQFNTDPRNNTFSLANTLTAASGTATILGNATTVSTLVGGTNGTTAPSDDYAGFSKAALVTHMTAEDSTFDQIDGVIADLVLFPDIYADDDIGSSPSQSFITNLAQFCYGQGVNSYPMHGVLGIRPINDTQRATIDARVSRLTTAVPGVYDSVPTQQVNIGQFISNGIPYQDPNFPSSLTIDLGRFINIHAGPDVYVASAKLGTYLTNPAAYYAGIISQLPAQRATTNSQIPGGVVLAYHYTKKQRNILNAGIGFDPVTNPGGGAFVTFADRNPGAGIVVTTSDVTAASRTSSFAQLQVSRITQSIEVLVESVATLFIGQPNEVATITALQSQLQTALDTASAIGALNGPRGTGYDFQIGTAIQDARLGNVVITMWIRPAREIQKVRTTISVS